MARVLILILTLTLFPSHKVQPCVRISLVKIHIHSGSIPQAAQDGILDGMIGPLLIVIVVIIVIEVGMDIVEHDPVGVGFFDELIPFLPSFGIQCHVLLS